MKQNKHIDASVGIPALSLSTLANFAFNQKNLKSVNQNDNLDSIASFFSHRGFKGGASSNSLLRHNIAVTSGGTTQGFELIINLLAQDIDQENQNRSEHIKPVMLMPTPTYGVFKSYPESKKIEVISIPRDLESSGKLDLKLLDDTIKNLSKKGKRVIAYYDANPHNPLGIVRGREETQAIAAILKAHSNLYEKEDKQYADHINQSPWKGPASRIRTIDDMVSDGLEYGEQSPYSFAQLESFSKDAFATFGTSKVGVFPVKAGLVLGNTEDVKLIRVIQKNYPSVKDETLLLLKGYFNLNQPFLKQREEFLSKLSESHKFSGLLMKSIINGIDNVEGLTDKDRDNIIKAVSKHKQETYGSTLNSLRSGMQGVTVITSPQAGFFHMLDFKELNVNASSFPKSNCLLHDIFANANVSFRGGSKIGLPDDKMIVRTTFALPQEEIIDLCDRLRASIDQYLNNNKGPSLKP
jgi:aspartate/methionine/tyrosine aminotransferase